MKIQWTSLLLATLPLSSCSAKPPVEVGNVEWMRSYPAAIAEAKNSDKPILALFQEVPG